MSWLSLPEYARQTGTPESTVRAAIRAGKLRAELEQRAPGDPRTVWRVWLDDPPEQPQEEPQAPTTGIEPSSAPEAVSESPAAITALVDALAAERAERQILSAEIRNLAERAARAEAERDILCAEVARLRARRWYDPRTW